MSLPISLPASRIEPPGEAQILRWGILGPGWIAERFIESVRAHTKQDIAAVGSRSKERAAKFAARVGLSQAYGDYKQLVAADDLDVIYVATPHNSHHEGVTLALNAGKHVLVEKPMALNRAQALEMVELARRQKLFLAEALWTFYLPKFDVLRQLLEAKAIGEIKSVYTRKRYAMRSLADTTSKACITKRPRLPAVSSPVNWRRRTAPSTHRSKPWRLST
jgi:predicted dehydrogenase